MEDLYQDEDTPDFVVITCPSCGYIFNCPNHLLLVGNIECPECEETLEAI